MKIILAVLLGLAALPVDAQQRGANNTVLSPEVHPDRKVTFRIRAPQAREVTYTTDWMSQPGKMEKDAEGVWTATVGPVEPSTYIYSFSVDGVPMPDPVNPKIKLRARGSASLVTVPASTPALWEPREVPRGSVNINWQRAKALDGEDRAIWIYTPPGYGKDVKRRYPVLYLLHGSNDTAAGWTSVGGANFIMDNMIHEKKVQPMIVVMPFGHATPFGTRGADNTGLFQKYLFDDVIPYVESEYRVLPDRKNRAIAGLSMGGDQSILIGFGNLDRFSAIGAFSPVGPRDFETRFPELLKDSKAVNSKLKAFYIACGRQDPGHFPSSERFVQTLAKHGVQHTFKPTEGAHNYVLWQQYLIEFLPMLSR